MKIIVLLPLDVSLIHFKIWKLELLKRHCDHVPIFKVKGPRKLKFPLLTQGILIGTCMSTSGTRVCDFSTALHGCIIQEQAEKRFQFSRPSARFQGHKSI